MTGNGEVRIHRKNAVVGGLRGQKGANRTFLSTAFKILLSSLLLGLEISTFTVHTIQSRITLKLLSKTGLPAPITTVCDLLLMLGCFCNPKLPCF